ncbi:hypothetical protein Q0N22_14880, partial [Staphylococcus aureus]|nr:hypothetical protein [Staphylococcus aureus]
MHPGLQILQQALDAAFIAGSGLIEASKVMEPDLSTVHAVPFSTRTWEWHRTRCHWTCIKPDLVAYRGSI